jgi:pimeloyl-ACP methyl ester carboxylesterase
MAAAMADEGRIPVRWRRAIGSTSSPALKRPTDYEKLMAAMKAQFIRQGAKGIVKARAVEDRLYRDTWQTEGYDLLPRLRSLRIPTLVLTGTDDFIPVEIAQRIARAIPDARFVALEDCGHFAYLECPEGVRRALDDFFKRAQATARSRQASGDVRSAAARAEGGAGGSARAMVAAVRPERSPPR